MQSGTLGDHSKGSSSETSAPTTQNSPSTGAKAGIGIGVAFGALALFGLLIWAIFERRRRRKRDSTVPTTDQEYSDEQYSDHQNSWVRTANAKHEMAQKSSPAEVGPEAMRSELDTGPFTVYR